jgi:RNA polymerase sigma-70 factor (ECF subfamily)
MTDQTTPDKSNQLVEHFFRHEYANLVSVLSRAFGLARIDLVEDMVSAAIIEAMNAWKQKGPPDNPAAWIHRVARNRILDAMRREKTHEKALSFAKSYGQDLYDSQDQIIDRWLDENELPDSLLRMIFVCCHPILDRKSQIALTLKILCGFSVSEIARGLLSSSDAIKKRIQRGKAELARNSISMDFPATDQLHSRLSVVNDVLYLMFNEGYSTTGGLEPIRDDICEEAARLCHLLCNHSQLTNHESCALLSLMLFHASRLDARTDSLGNIVLLGEQDRCRWDRKLIAEADKWLIKSVNRKPSRFHFEAVIAQFHCSAPSLEKTNWTGIARFYERLIELYPSPIYRLNHAIAIAQIGHTEIALQQLTTIRDCPEMKDYFLIDCACAYIQERAGDFTAATDSYLAALSGNAAEHQKQLIKSKLENLNSKQQP